MKIKIKIKIVQKPPFEEWESAGHKYMWTPVYEALANLPDGRAVCLQIPDGRDGSIVAHTIKFGARKILTLTSKRLRHHIDGKQLYLWLTPK